MYSYRSQRGSFLVSLGHPRWPPHPYRSLESLFWSIGRPLNALRLELVPHLHNINLSWFTFDLNLHLNQPSDDPKFELVNPQWSNNSTLGFFLPEFSPVFPPDFIPVLPPVNLLASICLSSSCSSFLFPSSWCLQRIENFDLKLPTTNGSFYWRRVLSHSTTIVSCPMVFRLLDNSLVWHFFEFVAFRSEIHLPEAVRLCKQNFWVSVGSDHPFGFWDFSFFEAFWPLWWHSLLWL